MIKFTKAEQGNSITSPTKKSNPSPHPRPVEKRRAKTDDQSETLALDGGADNNAETAAKPAKTK